MRLDALLRPHSIAVVGASERPSAGRLLIESLDRPVSEDDAYPRGLLFFLWMEKRWNREMVRKFVARVSAQGGSHSEALFDATGNTWARMAGEEQGWSQEYCKKLRK